MSIRVSRDLTLKERKLYTFGDFKGVDFSTSPYLVAKNRAISAENLIFENGTVRKRTGWKSLCKLPGEINGLFSFELDNEKIILAYAGTDFYILTWNDRRDKFDYKCVSTSSEYLDKDRLVSRRIQVYVNKNKAYIVGCGDYLVFGKWSNDYEVRKVIDCENVYIPTTTINIDEDTINDETRVLLDDVNLLSSYRINEMLGVDISTGTWTVDSAVGDNQAIDEGSDVIIELSTFNGDGNPIKYEIYNNHEENKSLLFTESLAESVGRVDFKSGKITLNINTKPQIEGEANIKIKFKHSILEVAEVIRNATISTIFGGNGNSNRLFLSGNSSYKNTHIWSEMYDFTYFPDTNYDEIGGDGSAIVGYVRATDGLLLVFKEKNGNDTTLYYVSGADKQEEDYRGDLKFITEFTKSAGNATDTIYGKYATASLNGDNLILTRNGVKGVDLYENITTNAYRLRERSRNINTRLLKEENLDNASAIVYKDKYYLSVNGVVYVCDSRFTYQSEEDVGDNFNYEWWFFTNVDARVWSEIDDRLCFGNSVGEICVFTDNEYSDTTFQDTEGKDILIDYTTNTISYNKALSKPLVEGSSIRITDGDVYSRLLDCEDILSVDEYGYIYIKEEAIFKAYEGLEIYADGIDGTGLEINKKYVIDEVNLDDLKISIVDESGDEVYPLSIGFNFCKKITGKNLYITNITEDNEFQVKEFADGDIINLVMYNYILPENVMATITFKQNVVAKWYTPIYDLGSNMYSKTLLGITITTEPLVKGSINIGYQTRNIEKEFTAQGIRGFDFADIDFEDFSFESSFTSSNTIRVKERNFNFIVIRYISDTETACAVNGITIRYKINRLNKGVR